MAILYVSRGTYQVSSADIAATLNQASVLINQTWVFDSSAFTLTGTYTASFNASGSVNFAGTVTFQSTAAVSVNSSTSWNFNTATLAGAFTMSGNVNFTGAPTFNTASVAFNGTQDINFNASTTVHIKGTLSIDSTGIINLNGNFDILGGTDLVLRANDSGDSIKVQLPGASSKFFVHDGSSLRITFYDWSTDDLFPEDNISSLGKSGKRWTEVWAVNGTIQTSFSKFKKNIEPQDCKNCLAVCEAMEPITFEWKEDQMINMKEAKRAELLGRKYFGFNADPLLEMAPEAVAGEDGIYTGAVVGHLLGAVKNLSARVKELEASIAAKHP